MVISSALLETSLLYPSLYVYGIAVQL